MNSRERFIATLNHKDTEGKIVFDIGSTKATGISASLLYRLRKAYGREEPVKVYDTFQMLGLVDEKDRSADYIIPNPFDKRVAKEVAKAVAEAARKSGVARI